jgi:protein transport protein SEC61 subunit gamma and related proteins
LKLFNREKTIQKSNKSFIERARDLQNDLEAKRNRIGKGKYGRVLKMARKPTNDEFTKTSKITFLGILLIGGIGFAIFLIATEVAPWIARVLGIGS